MADDKEDSSKKVKKKNNSKYSYSFGDTHPKGKKSKDDGSPTSGRGRRNNTRDGKRNARSPTGSSKSSKSRSKSRGGSGKRKKGKKKKKGARKWEGGRGDSEADEPVEPKPALKVQRKGDIFTIQVNPLKDLNAIAPNEDPYVDCDPLVFKIIKKRSPEEKAKVEARKMTKLKRQRNAEVRKALAEAVEDICKCAYMDVFCNDLTAIDKVIERCPAFRDPDCVCAGESLSSLSSNATWDIEYTPPFGCFDLAPRKTKKFACVETQYVKADTIIPEPPPPPPPPKSKSKNAKSATSVKIKAPKKHGKAASKAGSTHGPGKKDKGS
ncbi:hypothetical protein JYU34_018527 [Plutella xylostella]|uniref:DUF4776 domain-containing protein n=1 Tax=Plutella xylostella TaxID=51655 RepID=A0ABQ7PY11_PLUXY|nr:hypothetical protein JYU34_018527 [Plutella xylostella]